MAAELIFVFSYDIEDNRTRRAIADLLEQHGVRVQYSVFEVRCTTERAERLLDRLAMLRGPGDSLRMYCLTEDGRARSAARGGAPIPERQEFWLL
jgi:CRISPR-associated protein Cas2